MDMSSTLSPLLFSKWSKPNKYELNYVNMRLLIFIQYETSLTRVINISYVTKKKEKREENIKCLNNNIIK